MLIKSANVDQLKLMLLTLIDCPILQTQMRASVGRGDESQYLQLKPKDSHGCEVLAT